MEVNEILERSDENTQLCVAIEELSELQKEICKYIRDPNKTKHYDHIKEELADVLLMCEQLKGIFEIPYEELQAEMEYKLERTLKRLYDKHHHVGR